MKKKTNRLCERLNPAKLYLDDIEKIVETMLQISDKVEISNEEYSFESLDELKELKQEALRNLEITASHPSRISIHFKKDSIYLHASDDAPASRGILEKIKEIVAQRSRRLVWLLNSNFLSGGFFALSMIVFIFYGVIDGNGYCFLAGIIGVIIGWFWSWRSIRSQHFNYSVIILKHRIDAPSFFKRNRDKIIIAIIASVIGGIVVVVFQKIFFK